MDTKVLLAILDKNVNQEQLLKDLGVEFVLPFVEEKLANLDIIPNTDIDNEMIKKVIEFLKEQLK